MFPQWGAKIGSRGWGNLAVTMVCGPPVGHTIHQQMCSVPVVLTFHGGAAIREKMPIKDSFMG